MLKFLVKLSWILNMYYIKLETPIGNLIIIEENKKIKELILPNKYNAYDLTSLKEKETSLLKEAKQQLNLYFNKELKEFNLPLNIEGTEFQKKVYQFLMDIPYGKTCSYQDIAIKIHNPKSVRAVGNANNKNKIPIIIPCHRVIGKNKKLIGYGGGLDIKEQLLWLEKE